MCLWAHETATSTAFLAKPYVAGSGWGDTAQVEGGQGRVAIDPNGNAIVLWSRSGGNVPRTWAKRYEPSSGWGAGASIDPYATDGADRLSVAMGAFGNAIAVWSTATGIWASRYTTATEWSAPRPIADGSGAFGTQIAIAANGDALVVWMQNNGIKANWFR